VDYHRIPVQQETNDGHAIHLKMTITSPRLSSRAAFGDAWLHRQDGMLAAVRASPPERDAGYR
jgi:hypothetical protein